MPKGNNRSESYSKKQSGIDFFDTKDYFESINEFEVLPHEEQAKIIKKAKEGDFEAREKILNHNLKLVISIAKKMKGYRVPLMDLIAEGNLGLIRALEKFDPSKEFKFDTYATWWIKAKIYAAIYNIYEPSRKKSIKTRELIKKVTSRINELTSLRGHEIDPYEVYEELWLNEKECRTMNEYYVTIRHMDAQASDKEAAKKFCYNEEEKNRFGVDEDTLVEIMNKVLDEREKKILYHRFELKETLEVVGNNTEFNVSRERIRQIEEVALEKLKRGIMLRDKYNNDEDLGCSL